VCLPLYSPLYFAFVCCFCILALYVRIFC
jgi:hypothetical protein